MCFPPPVLVYSASWHDLPKWLFSSTSSCYRRSHEPVLPLRPHGALLVAVVHLLLLLSSSSLLFLPLAPTSTTASYRRGRPFWPPLSLLPDQGRISISSAVHWRKHDRLYECLCQATTARSRKLTAHVAQAAAAAAAVVAAAAAVTTWLCNNILHMIHAHAGRQVPPLSLQLLLEIVLAHADSNGWWSTHEADRRAAARYRITWFTLFGLPTNRVKLINNKISAKQNASRQLQQVCVCISVSVSAVRLPASSIDISWLSAQLAASTTVRNGNRPFRDAVALRRWQPALPATKLASQPAGYSLTPCWSWRRRRRRRLLLSLLWFASYNVRMQAPSPSVRSFVRTHTDELAGIVSGRRIQPDNSLQRHRSGRQTVSASAAVNRPLHGILA